jgi:hypothetical protein
MHAHAVRVTQLTCSLLSPCTRSATLVGEQRAARSLTATAQLEVPAHTPLRSGGMGCRCGLEVLLRCPGSKCSYSTALQPPVTAKVVLALQDSALQSEEQLRQRSNPCRCLKIEMAATGKDELPNS